MGHALDGARAKVSRAKEQIEEFGEIVSSFLAENYSAAEKREGEVTVFRAVVKATIPKKWSVIAGEICHNLRSAMDHTVWALVRANGNEHDRAAKRAEFPIYGTVEEYEDNKHKIKLLSDPAREMIRKLQPFHFEKDKVDEHSLYRLHHLNRIDKHRTLNLLVAASTAHSFIGGNGNIRVLKITVPEPGFPVVHDGILKTVDLADHDPGIVKHSFSFNILFDNFEFGGNMPELQTLVNIHDSVRETIRLFMDMC